MQRVLQSEIAKEQEYQALNVAKGIGRIHIIEKLDDHVEIGFNEILVLDEVPRHFAARRRHHHQQAFDAALAHQPAGERWGVPNAYIKNAQELFKQYDGGGLSFETKRDTYTIKRADNKVLDEYQKRLTERRDMMTPRFDLSVKRLLRLAPAAPR